MPYQLMKWTRDIDSLHRIPNESRFDVIDGTRESIRFPVIHLLIQPLTCSFSISLSLSRVRSKRVGTENNTRACECVSNWAFILRCLLYNIIFQFASVFLCVKIVREKQFVTKEVVYLILRVSQYISYPKLVNVWWSTEMAIWPYLIIINMN